MKFFTCLTVIGLFLLISLSSCQKEKICDVTNPLRDLPWLKEIKKNGYIYPKGMYRNIYQCTYNNGIDGFYIEPCVNCQDYIASLFSCEGTVLFDLQEIINYKIYHEEWNVEDKKLIWTNVK